MFLIPLTPVFPLFSTIPPTWAALSFFFFFFPSLLLFFFFLPPPPLVLPLLFFFFFSPPPQPTPFPPVFYPLFPRNPSVHSSNSMLPSLFYLPERMGNSPFFFSFFYSPFYFC